MTARSAEDANGRIDGRWCPCKLNTVHARAGDGLERRGR